MLNFHSILRQSSSKRMKWAEHVAHVEDARNTNKTTFVNGSIHSEGCIRDLIISIAFILSSRSQWPRGLRNELSSLVRTLESWVRIPLEAWMSLCVYSVFVLGSGLATG
jgi:hypothetical protein